MGHGPPHVAQDQFDDPGGGGGEAQDAKLIIHKDGGDARAGQQVVHVVVGPRQIRHIVLQFDVDRGQFLVDPLQLSLGGLQFLIGGLEILLLGPQFLLERRDARVGVRLAAVRLRAGMQGGWLRLFGVEGRRILQDDQVQGRLGRGGGACRHRADGQVDHREVAVGFHAQARAAHCPGCPRGFVQGRGQVAPQPFAGHLQDVVDSSLARGRFQVQAGAAVEVEDVALASDKRGGRGHLLQERLFGQLAQRRFSAAGHVSGGPRDSHIYRRHGRQKPAQNRALCAVKILLALIQLRFAVERGKKTAKLAHRLRSAQEEKTARVERVVEQGNERLLQVLADIDQQVAATDQVEFGKRRVFDHVLLGKDQQVADAFVDAIGAAAGLGREEPGQPLRREVGGDAGRIEAGAGRGNRLTVNVGGEDLHRETLLHRHLTLGQQDGDGIGFLAGGAAWRPDANHGACGLAGKELRDDLFLERLKGLRIAEKLVTPINRSQNSASTSAGVCCTYLTYPSIDSIWWTPMRRSEERWMVFGLYWEKSWPVWARSRIKSSFITFSALGAGAVAVRGSLPKAWAT